MARIGSFSSRIAQHFSIIEIDVIRVTIDQATAIETETIIHAGLTPLSARRRQNPETGEVGELATATDQFSFRRLADGSLPDIQDGDTLRQFIAETDTTNNFRVVSVIPASQANWLNVSAVSVSGAAAQPAPVGAAYSSAYSSAYDI